MNSLDKNYLSLQFSIKVFKKSGTEFQSFFEDIMERAYPDFRKIKPYGNVGDGGNDGYRKDSGIYYQVYSPNEPKINETGAIKKLKEDYKKLKISGWDEISKIKEYNFVFNDKYGGSIQKLEQAISELNKDNQDIKFYLFLARDLEQVFFKLKEPDMLQLGFNIDQRQALSNAFEYLNSVKLELDRENTNYAKRMLKNIRHIVLSLDNESLSIDYEILECRCLQKSEKVTEAVEKYKSLMKRFPSDPNAFLYLAEIYLNEKDYKMNNELLKKVEQIDENYWLLKLEKLVRIHHLGQQVDIKTIIESDLPYEPRIRSNFNRLYSLFLEDSGDQTNADSFIEKAIQENPDNLSNYIVNLTILEKRLFTTQDTSKRLDLSHKLLDEIKSVESNFFINGDAGKRNKVILNTKKLNALRILENIDEIEKISRETFELATSCYFDKQIQQIIMIVVHFVILSDEYLNKLLAIIKDSKKDLSYELLRELFTQFIMKDKLFSDGSQFYNEIGKTEYVALIKNIENRSYKEVLDFLENDTYFAISIANTLKDYPDLRRKIIENLPDDVNIQKEKLLLLLNFDEKEYDEAFNILKRTDLTKLDYHECKPILHLVQQKNAWDFEVVILKKLLDKEMDEKQKFNLHLQLFNAHFNLKQYLDVIKTGTKLLEIDFNKNYLDLRNREVLLSNTISAYIQRGKIDKEYYAEAEEVLKKYPLSAPSFEFKVAIEAEIYLLNNKPHNALKAIIEGVEIKKVLSPNEYAKLYFFLTIKIGNQIDLRLDSLDNIKENTFVKMKNKDQWYFFGNGNELDAIQINKDHKKYSAYAMKKLGEQVVFENEYGSDRKIDVIEFIFPIKRYVFWKAVQHFNDLSKYGDIEGVQLVEVPTQDENINLNNILKFMDHLNNRSRPFFELYCKNTIPLAMLAKNEGGLIEAIGRIQNEQKGYINFCTGTIDDFEAQKKVARFIINGNKPFYIDGTSALFLSEYGMLKNIHRYIPSLKVPQSVINFLGNVSEKFTYNPGQVGYMRYAQGQVMFSSVEKEERDFIKANFVECIKLLEANPNNIGIISSANKLSCFSEKEIPSELSDACILAQSEGIPILTEDFLYLGMNELETKKEAPKYFSSLALLSILYEDNKISYNEYLDYFGYLTTYRFRFLSLNSNAIEVAIFGDSDIKQFKPENIRKLNFPLTLSEEYGVSFSTSFVVIREFLLKILLDNSITSDMAEKIFIEVLDSFPTKENKRELGQHLIIACLKIIEINKPNFVIYPVMDLISEKASKLIHLPEIYESSTKLWIPSEEFDDELGSQ